MIVAGDFNCHRKNKTLKEHDDLVLIQNLFGEQLSLVDHLKPTCLAANEELSLDHFFMNDCEVVEIEVYPLPNYSTYQPFKKFFNEISDHLPVSVCLKAPF